MPYGERSAIAVVNADCRTHDGRTLRGRWERVSLLGEESNPYDHGTCGSHRVHIAERLQKGEL
jgi:hypothetical protein